MTKTMRLMAISVAAMMMMGCEAITFPKDNPDNQETPVEKHEAKALSLSSKQVDINKQQKKEKQKEQKEQKSMKNKKLKKIIMK